MRRLFIYASAVLLCTMVSCQKDNTRSVSSGDVKVSFILSLPGSPDIKAISAAENTDVVYYEIWNSDWSRRLYPVDNSTLASEPVIDKKASIEATLVFNQTYNFIFWAQNDACGAYDVTNLKKVGVDYSVIAAEGNHDKFDAFYAVKTLMVNGPISETIYLYRPFAQLNFGASQMSTSLGPINIGSTEVSVSDLATVFNTVDGVGEVQTSAPVIFKAEGLVSDTERLLTNNTEYTWTSMNYMLMMDDKMNVTIDTSFEVIGADAPVQHHVLNVPLKKNHRTNIVGDMFTSDASLHIVIDPAFDISDEIVGL